MSVPVTNRTIIVDAGHGGEDGGAVSSNGVSEAQINLSIALKLQNLLAKLSWRRASAWAWRHVGTTTTRLEKAEDRAVN